MPRDGLFIFGGVMRVSKRKPVNKGSSASQFRRNTTRTAVANVRQAPMRGGWRL